MKTRREYLIAGFTGAIVVSTPWVSQAAGDIVIKDATAITEVYGHGLRLVGVALRFDTDIASSSLSREGFSVEGRTVTNVTAARSPDPSDAAASGHFVIVMLDPEDASARLYSTSGRDVIRGERIATLQLTKPIGATNGGSYPAAVAPITTSSAVNLVVDDFEQRSFDDKENGITLRYNLFIPRNYDRTKTYPLVNFMHDASVTSKIIDTTLIQGLGAVVWARPEEQAKRPCFVLAPQFDVAVVNDRSEVTGHIDTVVRLIRKLTEEFSIDRKRLYTTGQSGGGMLCIAIDIKYPDLFAASFLVACQWDATLVAPLAKDKLFIVVAAEDAKAYPGQNAITERLETLGVTVNRAVWNGRWTADEFEHAYRAMVAQGAQVNYIVLKEGTVIPDGVNKEGAAGHMNTWPIAYTIEGVREWLFNQSS
ncbi:hypothetical protein [Agrobacterium tumefaciens]|uniref:hypothetical protein n=1 Tax=Agrobacterium tumefaciens TaxID=358 RepID=UPI0021FB2514|nr:hypothetical protein FY131_27700 [Agrobacterium tumefaciens]